MASKTDVIIGDANEIAGLKQMEKRLTGKMRRQRTRRLKMEAELEAKRNGHGKPSDIQKTKSKLISARVKETEAFDELGRLKEKLAFLQTRV